MSLCRLGGSRAVKRLLLSITLFCLPILGNGCGGKSPSSPSSRTVQVGGVWAVTSTLTSVTGGECLSAGFQSIVGAVDTGTMQISQVDSSLTATFTSNISGGSSSYQGTAGASSIALNETGCSACNLIGATCPNGARRDFRLQTGGVNATITGNSASGTAAETYNVFIAGTNSTVGVLTLNSRFSAIRR